MYTIWLGVLQSEKSKRRKEKEIKNLKKRSKDFNKVKVTWSSATENKIK